LKYANILISPIKTYLNLPFASYLAKRHSLVNRREGEGQRRWRPYWRIEMLTAERATIICRACGVAFIERISKRRVYCSWECKKTHGRHHESRTRLHVIWCCMKTRCHCETTPQYKYYGGRGISVCNEWRESYEAFRSWAALSGYSDSLELDRINNNGNYEPGNCRWATRSQQMANTRKPITGQTSIYKGVSFCKITRKWKVQIRLNGTNKYVGIFQYELHAALAYDDAAISIRGSYAMLNFPERKTSVTGSST